MNTNQKWYFNRDGVSEEVQPEKWAWGVIYKDGSTLHQYAKDGVFHQIGEVEQDKVKTFVVYKVGPEDKRYDIAMPEGSKVIYKYRRYTFNVGRPNEHKDTVYVFGYKVGNQTHYNYILPDDRLIQTNGEIALEEYGLIA